MISGMWSRDNILHLYKWQNTWKKKNKEKRKISFHNYINGSVLKVGDPVYYAADHTLQLNMKRNGNRYFILEKLRPVNFLNKNQHTEVVYHIKKTQPECVVLNSSNERWENCFDGSAWQRNPKRRVRDSKKKAVRVKRGWQSFNWPQAVELNLQFFE